MRKKICKIGKSLVILQKIKNLIDMMKKVLLSVSAMVLAVVIVGCAGGPAAEGKKIAQKACECQKLAKDDTKAAEAEACIEEWGEMIKVAYEKYENDEAKMKEFVEGGDSFKCE